MWCCGPLKWWVSQGVRDSEAAQKIWSWIKGLEGTAPGFGQAFLKSWVERQSAYKWARAVMETGEPNQAAENLEIKPGQISAEHAESLRSAIQRSNAIK